MEFTTQDYIDLGSPKDLIIPDHYTAIADRAFYVIIGKVSADADCVLTINKEALHSITIPDSVKRIGKFAFCGCLKLTSITIPNSVVKIGVGAFEKCENLESVTLPNTLKSIESYMFCFCKSLKSITIPSSVTHIKEYAFLGCASLLLIEIPKSVVFIGKYTFDHCDSLISITIPDNVTKIERHLFSQCKSLETVNISKSATIISDHAFLDCKSLKRIIIPNSVHTIRVCAFQGCSALSSVHIPDSVNSIEAAAFKQCTSLVSVNIPNSIRRLEKEVFAHCRMLSTITIPDSVESIAFDAFSGSPNARIDLALITKFDKVTRKKREISQGERQSFSEYDAISGKSSLNYAPQYWHSTQILLHQIEHKNSETMKIIDLKVNPSTVGMTSSVSTKRQVLILAYNATITYEDGTRKRKTVNVDTPMLPRSAYKGCAFGASYFIIDHQDTYYVFNSLFEIKNKIPISSGEIVAVEEDHFGLRQENTLVIYSNIGLIVDKRELTAEEITALDSH